MKNNLNKKPLVQAVIIAALALGTGNAFAHKNKVDSYMENCDTLPLVNTLIGGPVNDSVCVDAPVALKKAKVVFNMDTDVLDSKNRPTGLRHMWMLGTALKARINAGLVDPDDVSIIGVLHGTAINFGLKSSDAIVQDLIEKIFALKNEGVNINIEVCGVTMLGGNLTNDNLYASENGKIHVNQGAIGRLVDLQQHKYALIDE